MDTIFALSSGSPPAAIAIIRISGPAAFSIAQDMVGALPPLRQGALRAIRDCDGGLIDRALVLCFAAPASATGEDLVELHCHGSRAVADAIQYDLARRCGVRAAEAGEFTRRALTNGRIDLAQAEGLADLLNAATEAQRRAAIGSTEGRVGRAIGAWIERIALLSARVEALLDFADEGDVGADEEHRVIAAIAADAWALGEEIGTVTAEPTVERLHDGINVVIAGPPNTGKSTLLNTLAQREAAIVTPISGTTRDRIDVAVARNGIPYVLTDTAGLTRSDDPVEAIGVDRAHDAIRCADLVVWTGDEEPPAAAIWIRTRADLPGRAELAAGMTLGVSTRDPSSIEALWAEMERLAKTLVPREDALALNRRQHALCIEAGELLRQPTAADPLLLAERMRLAHQVLARITGADHVEQMLDALFTRFCVGK